MSVPSAVTSANNSDSQSPLIETVNVVIQDVRWESVPSNAEEALNSATTLPVVPEPEVGGTEETVLSTTETITIIEITSFPVEHEVGGHAISKVAEESGDQSNDDDGIFDLDELTRMEESFICANWPSPSASSSIWTLSGNIADSTSSIWSNRQHEYP
ncbi:hypothetical protein EW026_g966 [Hermanssonia centrifuga]|uniref:Uncharacterized protein n=1 Tax=Hermanssonia centrifuga TaxID=98765 RepID=A0A4S4KT56_9APHY|nr:hypothetical protein EW026_g966 [Hermanssonia centrifuga]